MFPDADEQVDVTEIPPREMRFPLTWRWSELSEDTSKVGIWPESSVTSIRVGWEGSGGGGIGDLFHAFRKVRLRFGFLGALCGAVDEHGVSCVESARARELLEPILRLAKAFGLIKWLKASFNIEDNNRNGVGEGSQGINDCVLGAI